MKDRTESVRVHYAKATSARVVRFIIAMATVATQSIILCAYAAPLEASADTTPGDALQEIVVTAEKRESTVQKTPISMTAISGDELLAQGVASVAAVASETPGISMRSAGPGQTEYEMRGLSSTGGSSPTVGFYLDEIPLTAPSAASAGKVAIDPDLFDLNRIEVLRGPQGTLYGSSSEGGTIKLVTNKPTLDRFEGAAQSIESDTDGGGFNYGGNAMVNLPLSDHVAALRLVGSYKYADGFVDYKTVSPFPIGYNNGTCFLSICVRGNVASAPVVHDDKRANWERLEGGRADLLLQPSDSLSINLLFMEQDLSMGGLGQVDIPPGPDVSLTHYQPFALSEPFYDRFAIYAGTLKYGFDAAELTSATAYWQRTSSFTGDVSEQFDVAGMTYFGGASYPFLPVQYSETNHTQQTSQEVRLASTTDGRLQWLVGGYFQNYTSTWQQYSANPAYAYLSVPTVPGGNPLTENPLGLFQETNNPYSIKQYALFSQSSYLLTDSLKATLGLRWYRYQSNLVYSEAGIISQTGNATALTGGVATNDSGYNPKINISYAPNTGLTVYADASRGFRPGGLNIPTPVALCGIQVPLSYGPDFVWNYELGEKAKLFDGRFTVHADYFYMRWSGVQQQLGLVCGSVYTANAGLAVSYGPELEIAAELTAGLEFTVGGAYTQASIKSVNPAVAGDTLGPTKVLEDGTALVDVPRYTMSSSLKYTKPLADGLDLTARLDATRIGPMWDFAYYYEQLAAYTLLRGRIGLFRDKRWSGSLFVDNIANKHAITTINNTGYSISIPSLTRGSVTQPRTAGLDVQFRF